jgi:twitching motility two-component system response regulator PilH
VLKKVLVVDDSPADLANLRSILDAQGIASVIATSGREALEKAVREKPDLILLDIVMPDMDGYEACRRLQADPELRAIPVVFVSSKNQKADHLWAKMQGAKALVCKPYTAAQITDALKTFG